MAKGVEDTAFYRYTRLLALNEVGGDPGRFGARRSTIPRRQRRARAPLPARPAGDPDPRHQALAATCARASARSPAMADEWRERVRALVRAERAAAPRRRARRPTRSTSIYQTLVGVWPLERRAPRGLHGQGDARGQARHQLDRAERATGRRRVLAFVGGLYATAPFLARLRAVRRRGSPRPASAPRSARRCCKLTAPGVPDIYQGDELWDLALVDPDNRRPVDWDAPAGAARRARLRRGAARARRPRCTSSARPSPCARAGPSPSRATTAPSTPGRAPSPTPAATT